MRHLIGMALLAMTMACASTARAAEEYDPAKVSDSLKAIFQFGSVATKQALNQNTVTLISGTIGGTYVQFGADLASVLDDGNKLRVLPIVGRGSVQSVADILFLQGVDLGIVRADTLDYLEKKGFAKDIKKQFTYVTKLYNEEMYVIASKSVRGMSDLNGKKVSVDLPNGGTFVTAAIVFERLGIKPNFLYLEQRIAMEKMRAGEIDAVVAVGGKPYKSVSNFNDNRFHLVPVDYAKPLQTDYLPATLTSKDYPNLIPEGGRVDTIASTPLPDWQRLPVAEQWLKTHNVEAVSRARFDEFLKQSPATAATVKTETDREALFRQFQTWEAERSAKAQARAAPR